MPMTFTLSVNIRIYPGNDTSRYYALLNLGTWQLMSLMIMLMALLTKVLSWHLEHLWQNSGSRSSLRRPPWLRRSVICEKYFSGIQNFWCNFNGFMLFCSHTCHAIPTWSQENELLQSKVNFLISGLDLVDKSFEESSILNSHQVCLFFH